MRVNNDDDIADHSKDVGFPAVLTPEDLLEITDDFNALQEEKAVLKEAKKTWNKFTLLSLCADCLAKLPVNEATLHKQLTELIGSKMSDRAKEEFVTSLPLKEAANAYDEMCKTLQINKYCKPKPGQVMGIVTPGASDLWNEVTNANTEAELAYRKREYVATKNNCKPAEVTAEMMAAERLDEAYPKDPETWNFHWAAVVAAEGDDYMTFENFSVEDPSAINDGQVFNGFGADKTFYEHYKDSGFFGTAAVAMCFDPVT